MKKNYINPLFNKKGYKSNIINYMAIRVSDIIPKLHRSIPDRLYEKCVGKISECQHRSNDGRSPESNFPLFTVTLYIL